MLCSALSVVEGGVECIKGGERIAAGPMIVWEWELAIPQLRVILLGLHRPLGDCRCGNAGIDVLPVVRIHRGGRLGLGKFQEIIQGGAKTRQPRFMPSPAKPNLPSGRRGFPHFRR
jgi:hypothetical protein